MTPLEIFHKMFDNDPFSQWMGMELVAVDGGTCTLRMAVRPEMLNGFGVAHGAITFALADSAFAFACNSRGRHALSIHCTVEHLAPVRPGDLLTATARELHLAHTLSRYEVTVTRPDGEAVALFRGVAYRRAQDW
jgi:acyl-CoA thioesterase